MTHPRLWWLLAVLLVAGCTTQPRGVDALPPTVAPQDALARITFRDGTQTLIAHAQAERFSQTLYGAPGQPAPLDLVLDELIARQLLLHRARELDITPDSARVDRTIEQLLNDPQICAARVGSEAPGQDPAARQRLLDRCAQTFGFEDGLRLRSFVAEEITIDQVARREAPKDMVRAAHILVDDQAQAQQIYDQLCGGDAQATTADPQPCRGEQFAALARQYSIEPNAQQSGGELPPFDIQGVTDGPQPSQFNQTFVSATWELTPTLAAGQEAISRPFQTQFGWHIVRLLELVASSNAALQYRAQVVELAKTATPDDLQQPYTPQRPLIGVVELLQPLPDPAATPTP